jgi:hypothetical protein
MKKFIYILVLSLFVFNCSKDDDEDINITFLEKYEGTIWEMDDDDDLYDYYFRIIDNLNTPLEDWDIYEGDDCYEYDLVSLSEIGFEVTENSEDYFKIKYLGSSDEMVDYYISLTVIDNSLYLKYEGIENGIITQSSTDVYLLTSIDVDSFILCD